MEQSEKEKYKLSSEEHQKIYIQIEEAVFRNVGRAENPVAIIVGGQSGSGKGALISYSRKQVEKTGTNIIIISTDEYKPFHPSAIELAKLYPINYVEIIEQDAGPWTGQVLKKAIDEKYNFIFEGTLKNDRILDRIRELKENGFRVIVRALAVPKMESLLSVHERYQNQMERIGFGRLISVKQHNEAYEGVPETIDKIEKSGLCKVEIYKRGKEITEPIRIYSSDSKDRIYANARMALVEGRKSEERKAYLSAPVRIEELREAYKKRNASEGEFEELAKVEEYLNDLIR